MTPNEVSLQLNHLLERNRDAELGYLKATENVKNLVLKTFLANFAHQRFAFGQDIKGKIFEHSRNVHEGSSMASESHRKWINIKSAFSKGSDKAILEECILGEERALEDYNQVINLSDLTANIRRMLIRHRDGILEALQNLREINGNPEVKL